MSLIARMEDEVKQATLARDADRRDALRLLLSALRSAEKELLRPLSDEEELQVLQRERKRRIEAAEAFRGGGRNEQAGFKARGVRRGYYTDNREDALIMWRDPVGRSDAASD